jgi:hypothetical protein
VVIYLQDKRRQAAAWLQKIQHLIGGVPLLLSGVQNFADDAERPMAVVEIVIALLVLTAFIKETRDELRKRGEHHDSAFGWFDLAAGGLLIFEAFHGAHHKPGYLRPQFLSGVVTIGVGLFHGRLHHLMKRKRYLKLDEDGLEFRVTRFRHLRLRWEGLKSIDLSGSCASFERTDGRRHKVRLNVLHDSEKIKRAIAEHAASAGVPTQ